MSQSDNQIVNPSGCFIFLQAKKMIDPVDDEQYSAIQKTFFSTSITVGLFSFLWARFYELGKYKFMIPNRLMFYVEQQIEMIKNILNNKVQQLVLHLQHMHFIEQMIQLILLVRWIRNIMSNIKH